MFVLYFLTGILRRLFILIFTCFWCSVLYHPYISVIKVIQSECFIVLIRFANVLCRFFCACVNEYYSFVESFSYNTFV